MRLNGHRAHHGTDVDHAVLVRTDVTATTRARDGHRELEPTTRMAMRVGRVTQPTIVPRLSTLAKPPLSPHRHVLKARGSAQLLNFGDFSYNSQIRIVLELNRYPG